MLLHSEVRSDFLHDSSGTDFIRAVCFLPVKIKREAKHGIYTEERYPLKQQNEKLSS